MSIRRFFSLGASVLLCAALFSGCSKDSDRVVAGQAAPLPGGGAGGTVSALTGDDDSQVSAETQLLVSQAILLDENDAPLEF